MVKENIEITDIRELLQIIKEYKPKVNYYTLRIHEGYSQNEGDHSSLNKVENKFYEDNSDMEDMFGEYDKNKPVFSDDVFVCGIGTIKLKWFVEILDDYITSINKDSNDWSFDSFFQWFRESEQGISDKKPEYIEIYDLEWDRDEYKEIFEEDSFIFKTGYDFNVENNISCCCGGVSDYHHYGISIDKIETEDKIISFDLEHDMSY